MSQELLMKDTGVIVRAEIDIQISTAKSYPRNMSTFVDRAIKLATLDQETAESCIYCLSRKNKDGEKSEIKGSSIRLAEIAASCWGNINAQSRVISNDGKIITAEGVAWDLESNVRMGSEVRRSIVTSTGKTYGIEMQAVTGNAACAIALRNAIFKIIPKALSDRIYHEAVKYAIGDQKTINHKRKNLFDRFNKIGVDKDKIFSFFNKNKIEEFDENDMEVLIGIGTSIKQGDLKIDDAFVIDDENYSMNVNQRIQNLIDNKKSIQTPIESEYNKYKSQG